MTEREELKQLIIENPQVCDRLLEIVRLLIAQSPHCQSKEGEAE